MGALPLPDSEAGAEEQLELMGYNSQEASLLLTGTTDVPEPKLYTPEARSVTHSVCCYVV